MATKESLSNSISAIDTSITDLKKEESDINVQIQALTHVRDSYKGLNPVMVQLYNTFDGSVKALQEALKNVQTTITQQETQRASLQADLDKLNNPPKPAWIYILIALFILLIIAVIAFLLLRRK